MIIALFIIGLIVGSFLNAVIFRLQSGESFLFKRSHCRSCQTTLKPGDLIPVFSFLFLKGRCRYCSVKLSWQYPLVELTTAIIFVLISILYPVSSIQYWFEIVIACFLIVIATYDFKHYLILDKVVLPGLAVVIFRNLYLHNHVWLGLASGFGIAGFFLVQYLISKGKWIGLGDVKLGLFLGNLAGWPLSILVLMLAYLSGAIAGIILIGLGKKKLESKLPFGVFLSFSAIIVMLVGNQIMERFLKLIGL
jgi:leader peptidase (prepilin peptidase)/N-methyltransferase